MIEFSIDKLKESRELVKHFDKLLQTQAENEMKLDDEKKQEFELYYRKAKLLNDCYRIDTLNQV